ncbi:MAG: sterol desaturase family protein [Saprospiraceae bacterium]|nr:sterol desaturase family protein [Saprospiraceae bacterium]
MKNLNFLALAVPFFCFFMLVEYWVSRRQGKQFFHFSRVISNLNIGIAERSMDIFVAVLFYFFYDYLHAHFAIFEIPSTLFWWVVLLLCTDLVFYWYHRFGHEVNLFWSLHIVHHQSEDYNFTTGTRVTIFQAAVRTCFWAILPIIGFSAPMISVVLLVHGVYPFFTHTRTINKLGWLEYILVTPSHHRVHHATNEQYLDKNYGNVFIFWDYIFGTFEPEKEEPVYGLTKQLESHSFLWQHFHYIFELAYAVKRAKGIRQKLGILFGRPEILDPQIRLILERKYRIDGPKKVKPPTRDFNGYVMWQTGLIMVFLFLVILFKAYLSTFHLVLATLFIMLTLINCGAILDRRDWVFHLEYSRLFIVWLAMLSFLTAPVWLFGFTIFMLIYWMSYEKLEQKYLQIVYR